MEIAKKIKLQEEAIAIVAHVCPIVKKFDGKVFNKKLSDALKAATDHHVYVSTTKDIIYMEYYHKNYGHCTLAMIKKDELTNRRINADLFITKLNDKKAETQKRLFENQEGLKNIERWKSELKQLQTAIRGVIEQIPVDILYDNDLKLHYRITRY